MPEKPLDRRAKMTRELLKQSLIELMKDRPIHEISIKKICETADINRSTFYHHYDSQYELFNEILNDVSHEIAQIVAKHQTSIVWLEEILCEALTYVDVNKDTILAAHAAPKAYPNLVVRVTGFTAYFSALSPEFRQLVVDRILTE